MTGKGQELTLRRTFRASRERVFAAWTDPVAIRHWFTCEADGRISVAETDVRVGGAFRITIVHGNGTEDTAKGVYTEVSPPSKLSFTWEWVNSSLQPTPTSVDLDFIAQGESTELVLTHRKLSSNESRAAHTEGWTGCFEGLASYVESD